MYFMMSFKSFEGSSIPKSSQGTSEIIINDFRFLENTLFYLVGFNVAISRKQLLILMY